MRQWVGCGMRLLDAAQYQPQPQPQPQPPLQQLLQQLRQQLGQHAQVWRQQERLHHTHQQLERQLQQQHKWLLQVQRERAEEIERTQQQRLQEQQQRLELLEKVEERVRLQLPPPQFELEMRVEELQQRQQDLEQCVQELEARNRQLAQLIPCADASQVRACASCVARLGTARTSGSKAVGYVRSPPVRQVHAPVPSRRPQAHNKQ